MLLDTSDLYLYVFSLLTDLNKTLENTVHDDLRERTMSMLD